MNTKFFDRSLFALSAEQWMAFAPYLWLCLGLAVSVVYAGHRGSRLSGKIIATLIFGGFGVFQASTLGLAPQNIFGSSLEIDSVTRIVGVSVALFALICSYFGEAADSLEEHPEWLPLMIVSVLGLSMLPGARDFIAFFVYLETLAISGYILVASDTGRSKSLEAGLKYLLMGAFASALFLMGITLIYGISGSFDFDKIAQTFRNLSDTELGFAIAGSLLLSASLMFKVALVPFHMWSPDVYQAAPTSVAAYLASATKVSIFAATAIVLTRTGMIQIASVQKFIHTLAVLSIVLGSFLAVAQTKIRRIFAYSGIVNAGYAALALCVGAAAVGSMLTNLIIYGATLVTIFAVIEVFAKNLGKTPHSDISLSELSIAAKATHPITVSVFAIAVFSIAGIPPLPGFFGKYLILKDLWVSGFKSGVYAMLLGTLLGLAYYLRLFVPLYMSDDSKSSAVVRWGGWAAFASFLAMGVSILVLGGLNRLPAWINSVEIFAR